jgi:insecticidal toxin complex protein TccC
MPCAEPAMPHSIHAHTPRLDAVDSRAAPVRQVNYCRVTGGVAAGRRVERHIHDAAGRDVAQWDARLVTRANTARVFGLGGRPVLEDNVDAGWRLTLAGEAGQPLFEWDNRGGAFHACYDSCLRVTARREGARVVERCYYGEVEAAGDGNVAGRQVRQVDSAGSLETLAYGLGGQVQIERRRFSRQIEAVSWPATPEAQGALLQEQAWTTTDSFDACGMLRARVDAGGHRRELSLDMAGRLASMTLTLAGSAPQVLCSAIHYNAQGQVESELLGNGTRTQARYAADSGRLLELTARRADGGVIRALRYRHDPVGNTLAIEDLAEPPRFYRNQRIDGVCRYRYDSLYQLTEATGWEVDVAQHGAGLPPLQAAPLDPSRLRRYTRAFTYDEAGNLLRRRHSDAPSLEMFTSAFSNRSLENGNETDIAGAFDANGNRLYLGAGQALRWSARNQLLAFTTVTRADGPDDGELYAYDASGLRARKQSCRQVAGRTLSAEVLYLPGVEIHHDPLHDESWHSLQLETSRDRLQVLRWVNGSQQSGVTQLRYSVGDHLGSGSLELDGAGQLLSQESYYPFGGTAIWAGRNAVEARYKTRRYSGKELDATGLYYYGFRYYAPWLQRWLSADPAGAVNGLNWYLNEPHERQDTVPPLR